MVGDIGLDLFTGTARSRLGVDGDATEHMGRYLHYATRAADAMDGLLDGQSVG